MRTIDEILDELENHLFDKYCVQGDDEKLKNIFDDIKEIQKQEKEQIIKALEKRYEEIDYYNNMQYYFGFEDAMEIVEAGGKE